MLSHDAHRPVNKSSQSINLVTVNLCVPKLVFYGFPNSESQSQVSLMSIIKKKMILNL